jgi:hypothetical protein
MIKGQIVRRESKRALVWMGLLACLAPSVADAGSVTLAWNPSASQASGYLIQWQSENGSHVGLTDVGAVTTATIGNLTNGVRYFFTAVAYDSDGLRSVPSNQVSAVVPATPPPPPPPNTVTSYFAEGVAGLFNLDLALVNTSSSAATVTLTFLPEGAPVTTRQVTVPGQAQVQFSANNVSELAGTPFGITVAAPVGVYAERTVSWSVLGEVGATTAKSIAAPARNWYLAEGNSGYFDTFVLLANANNAPVDATVDFLLDDGSTIRRQYTVAANQRLTVYANEIPGMLNRSFGTTVNASAPILVERAMYFRGGAPFWRDGHASAAVTAGARQWFLAEGRTGDWFDTFVLLANPASTSVTATIRYLTPSGVARTETRTLPPTSRTTIIVDALPGLGDTDVSCDISATGDIIVERSMYWPGNPGPWYGAHNSVGLTALGVEWAFAEGRLGGATAAQTFILLANPGTSTANVTLTLYRSSGAPLVVNRQVGPGGRQTIDASSLGLSGDESFGGTVVSDRPIAVERSLYWSVGSVWTAGSNETAFRVR